MEMQPKKVIKMIVSILAGMGITLAAAFYTLMLLAFSPERMIYIPLLALIFVSLLLFLVLWNIKRTKFVYFILCIPLICVVIWGIVSSYHVRIRQIPTLSEERYFLHRYSPFAGNNSIAKLDERSSLTITGNFPVLDGATALFPVYASFVEAVCPKDLYHASKMEMFPHGTDAAYRYLFEGEADLIFCAGPSDEQLRLFQDNDMKLRLIPIGKEAFVFFVNKENSINGVTVEQIRGIYSGEIKNWKELKGQNREIRAFQRPPNSGSQTMLEKIMAGSVLETPPRENVSADMGGIINQVADYRNFPNAIGYSFLFFSTEMLKNDEITLLSINGIRPTKESIQDNSYPFSDYFFAIYIDTEERNENIDPFIEWILSEQGQSLIEKSGYT